MKGLCGSRSRFCKRAAASCEPRLRVPLQLSQSDSNTLPVHSPSAPSRCTLWTRSSPPTRAAGEAALGAENVASHPARCSTEGTSLRSGSRRSWRLVPHPLLLGAGCRPSVSGRNVGSRLHQAIPKVPTLGRGLPLHSLCSGDHRNGPVVRFLRREVAGRGTFGLGHRERFGDRQCVGRARSVPASSPTMRRKGVHTGVTHAC